MAFAAVAVVAMVCVASVAWPLARHYSGVMDWLREHMSSEQQGFDRQQLSADLMAAGFSLGNEAHVRIFKREAMLELWMRADGGRYRLFRSYPICTYSGDLGPKLQEGDHQSPEGFYRVSAAQLNPGVAAPSGVQSRISQCLRPAAQPDRFGADGAWRLFVDRLLCDG